jgi:O-antigen ligase
VGAVAAAAFLPAAAAIAAAAVAVAVWRWPRVGAAVGAFVVLAVRPSLDVFSERRYGVGPFALDPAVVVGAATLLVAAVLALRRVHDGRRVWPDVTILHAHVWLLLAYGVAFWSGWHLFGLTGLGEGVRELVRVASVVAAFLIVAWWAQADPSRYVRGWVYLALGAVIPIAVALGQLTRDVGFYEPSGLLRIQGTFSHPNAFGQYLAPFVLATVALATTTRGPTRWLSLGLAAGLVLLVTLTYSRTALLVVATGLVALPILQRRDLGLRSLGRALLVVLVFGALGWLLVGRYIEQRFADVAINRMVWDLALTGASENSFTWRLINWAQLIQLGLSHRWLGHGAGMTTRLNPLINMENGLPFNAHDDFVRFFFEGGAVGLLCYLVYGALLWRWAQRQARLASADRAGTACAVSAALVALFFLTAGTTELSLHTANLYALYGMLALLTTPGALDAALARPGVGLGGALDRSPAVHDGPLR